MEDIHQNQAELFDALTKLFINIKKDSSSRKVGDYFRRRLDILENYWSDFQRNHNRLCVEEIKSHPYFVQNDYERAARLHQSIKALLCQDQELTEAGPSSAAPRSPDPQPTSKHQAGAQDEQASMRRSPVFLSRSTSSKTEEMLKKQSSNFRAFERTIANFNLEDISEKWELEDALKTLEARWSVIDSLHWELDGELEGSNYQYDQSYTKYENKYISLKKAINIKLWSVAHKVRATPKMDIPIFAGSYQQWTSFKDLFTETIHNNCSISNAQKMQYLKSKLRGEAERLIQHLPISSDNYNICWDIINHRYNNIKLICSSHLDTLLSVPVIQQATVHSIKRLHDTTVESLNAIKNLGIDVTSWDPLLLHLLTPKLDSETYNDYAASIKDPRALPNIQDFLSFLEGKFTSMESSRKKHENYSNKTSGSRQPKNNFYSHQPFTAQNQAISQPLSRNYNSVKYKCMVCKTNEHAIYYCPQFTAMPPHIKRKTLVKLDICQNCLYCHSGQDCLSIKRCRKCSGKHNTLLHEAFTQTSRPSGSNIARNATNDNVTRDTQPEVPHLTRGHSNASLTESKNRMAEVLLPTAMIRVQAHDGTIKTLRAFLDQGSQVCLISEYAAQLLGLPRRKSSGIVCGIGEKESNCKGVMRLDCTSTNNDFQFTVNAYIMNKIVKKLPNNTFLKPTWTYLDNITLADPDFNLSRPIDLLLSSSVYSKILLDGVCRATEDSASAQNTRLGWIISGDIVQSFQCNVALNNLEELHQFWAIEDITESSNLSAQDQQCMDFYKETTKRYSDGTYEVRLPLQDNFEHQLGSSKHKAIAQFNSLERKFHGNEYIAKQYRLFIQEYKSLGHMKPTSGNSKPDYYLPHHCVLRNDSTTTALRVVFNASAKTTSGYSLNDLMLKGPNLQQDLQSLLLKWRQYRIAFTADIEKMFRFIWLNEQDQKLQKIIWRDAPDMQHQVYQLRTVTYGTKAAPFLAMRTLKQLAEDERHHYDSETIKALEQSFYMDDVLHGGHCVESAIKLQKQLIKLLKSGGFNLRKWSSNAPELRRAVSDKQEERENFDFKEAESSKALGLRWNADTDSFRFSSKIEPSTKSPTKRTMLSDISKLFDPLGWLSPLSTRLKLIFQKVWTSNIQWDERLPQDIYTDWVTIRDDMHKINQFEVKRWLGTGESDHIELHGFCDSSSKAYACVVYCKQIINGEAQFTLVAGKSRVVPASKTVSLPRLELCGALLLAKLTTKIQQCLSSYTIKMYSWTDSMVVLAWLQGEPGRWKPFVANRVRQITSIIPIDCWRYIKSADNPADCASRGLTADQLSCHSLWWEGPTWLRNFNNSENIDQPTFSTFEEIRKTQHVNYITPQDTDVNTLGELLKRYSSLTKLTRVLAWVLKFIEQIKQGKKTKQAFLTLTDTKHAKYTIIRFVQEIEFTQEINSLQQNKQISPKSALLQLNPFLDEHKLLRVGGRLRNANINPDMMNPIIIPHEGPLTNLIIDHAHMLTFHGGPRVTSAAIRQAYWIIGGNRAVKKRIRSCITCRKNNPSKGTQIMGDLPIARCNVAKPFQHTGVDFTGHVFIKANKGRGIKTSKGYIAVFICMVTKLVHLELVSDLTSPAFLAALRRMAGRRGTPQHLYSDNGTNFIGANKILQEELREIQRTFDPNIVSELTNMNIEWHFNAPSWPTAGGLWEAAVKSLKYHLRRVVGEQKLTFEEFSTILAQLEAVLNSRPLCPLTEDPEDLEFLTPSSFININQHMTILETETDMRTRWHLTQKIVHDVWKRWQMEYLSQLTTRSKWRQIQPDIKINDIVTVNDVNLPPGKWAVGRVLELHPGIDGHVRVVTLKTKNGLIKRPITKLSILPVNERVDNQETKSDKSQYQHYHRKPKYSIVSLSMLLVIFLSIFTTTHCYNITRLKDNQGLYFDKISNMQLIRDEWKIVAYYNMEPYWQGTQACSKYMKYLTQLCSNVNETSHCDVIQVQLQQEFSELQYYNHLLLSQHSSTRRARSLRRRKRGLINGVGYLASDLFGVLDERFAEQYKQDIKLLQQNEDHLLSLTRNQTSLIEAEYNVLKRNKEALHKQHKMLNYLSLKIDSMKNTLLHESRINRNINDFSTGAIATSNILRHLKSIQTSLLDTITDVYHGRLNFQLLSPEQLKDTLNSISGHLAKDLALPISNLQSNFRNIYRLLKVKARMSEEYLIFELKLPLVSRDSFAIMRAIPIPQIINNSSMATIVPIAEYVALNLKKDSYITMSAYEVQACLHDAVETYLCRTEKPIFHLKNDEKLCELELNTKECKISVTTCTNQWSAINNVNKYVYFCCSQCQIRLLCEDGMSIKYLEKAGILGVEQDCLIKTESFTVFSHNEGLSNLRITSSVKIPEIEPINHIINAGIPISLIQNYTLPSNSKELAEIKNQISNLKANENLPNEVSYHDIHHYTVLYVIIGAAAIIGTIIIARRIRRKRTASHAVVQAALANLPVATGVASTTMEAGPSTSPPKMRVYSVSARNPSDVSCSLSEIDNSEMRNIHRVDKCTVPIFRKTEFN